MLMLVDAEAATITFNMNLIYFSFAISSANVLAYDASPHCRSSLEQ